MLTCKICGHENTDLKNHIKRAHKMGAREYMEQFGESPRPQEILDARQQRKDAKRIKCDLCGDQFLSRDKFESHFEVSDDPAHSQRAYIGTEGRDYIQCKICDLRRRKLDRHIVTAHDMTVEDYKIQFNVEHVICVELVEDNREFNGMKSEENREKFRGEGNPFFGKTHPQERLNSMVKNYKVTIAERYPNGHFNEGLIRSDEFKKQRSIDASKHTYGKGGLRSDLGHYCRSRLEANYARILKFQGKAYTWEHQTFMVTMPDGETSAYTPDFYLPDEDMYVETKPYMMDDGSYKNSEKIELFKIQYPNINFKMIVQQSQEWQDLKSQYRLLIPEWED